MNCPIDIIIIARNAEKTLHECLRSVTCLAGELRGRILFIDNASTDQTKTIAMEYPEVEYFYEAKRGRSQARNRGLKEAKSEFIVFLDSDIILEPNWLNEVIKPLKESKHIVGVESFVSARKSQESESFWKLRSENKEGRELMLTLKSYDFPILNTAACLYKRDAVLAIGGFDESLNSYEDIDLSKRIALNRGVLATAKSAKAYSLNSNAHLVGFAKRYFELGRFRFSFNYKWSRFTWREQMIQEVHYFKTEFKSIFQSKSLNVFFLRLYLLIFKNIGKLWQYLRFEIINKVNLRELNSFKEEKSQCILTLIEDHLVLYNFTEKTFKYYKKPANLNNVIERRFL